MNSNVAKIDGWRDTVRGMAEMLENGEWANVLSTDADLARLDAAISSALQGPASDKKDAARLMYAFQADGFTNVEKDRYDYAMECCEENGRDEPNAEDELNGVRRLIDASIDAAAKDDNA